MPNTQTKRLAHGAMMIALFTVFIAIAFYVPIISAIATLFAPLPMAWFSATYDRKSSISVAIVGSVVSFFFGGLAILPFSLTFAIVGIVIGDALRLKKSKAFLYMSSSIAMLLTLAVMYIISVKLFNADFVAMIKESLNLMRESYEKSLQLTVDITGQSPITTESLDLLFKTLELAIPSSLTIAVFFLTFIIISVNLPILKRFKINIPKFNAFKDLRFPRAILWYYLIVVSINLFISPEFGTPLYVIVLNFSLVLWVLLSIQGISFVHYCIEQLGLPNFLKVLVIMMAIPFYSLFVLVGILDLGFDIRSFVKGKIQK